MAGIGIIGSIQRTNQNLKRRLWPDFPRPKLYYKNLVEAQADEDLLILHAGGGRNKHGLFQGRRVNRINVDLDRATLVKDGQAKSRILGDLERLPLRDQCIDLIVCEMVFEHVAHPAEMIREFYRCLKANGQVIFIAPNLLSYPYLISWITPFWFHKLYGYLRGRREEDVFDTYYRLNTKSAIHRYFGEVGFQLVRLTQIDSACDYLDIFPIIYVPALALSMLVSRISALSVLRQFHVGWFRKPVTRTLEPTRINEAIEEMA